MKSYHFIIFIILIIIQLYLCLPLLEKRPEKCIKNSTDSIHYPPYFKLDKICKYEFNYTLVPFGDKFSFNCKYDSNPPSTVVWARFNKTIDDIDIVKMSNSSKLTIDSVTLDHEGKVSHSFFLHVNNRPLVHPIFYHKNENVESELNGEATLDCSFQSDEPSGLYFYKANKKNNFTYDELSNLNIGQHAELILYQIDQENTFDLLPDDLMDNETSESITLNNLTEDNFGIYMCIADNRYGKQVKFINLQKKIEIKNDNNNNNNDNNIPLIISIVLTSSLVVLIILVGFTTYKARKNEKELKLSKKNTVHFVSKKRYTVSYNRINSEEVDINDGGTNDTYNIPTIKVEEIEKQISNQSTQSTCDEFLIDLDEQWEIDRDRLEFDEVIGTGNFGVVERAILHDDKQLIKKNDYVNDSVVLDKKSNDNQSKISESPTKQLNHLDIIEHYKPTLITAFNNNYYGINSINSIDLIYQPKQILYGNYGKIEFSNLNNSIDETEFNQKAKFVAVKKLKIDFCENDVLSFVVEMNIMKNFANHKNLINLIGCCTQKGPLYLIMEFAELGNLKDFLKDYKNNNCYIKNQNKRLTTNDLINFALQIANGMEHLSSHNFIHRDLAARNILVTSDLTMKISDFGLSKSISNSEYYRKVSNGVVPIKWLAPECFEQNLYTIKSDVWSYGVTLWELTSLGCTPYNDLPVKHMFIYLNNGERMSKPKWCNNDMYKLMLDCWDWDPKLRPFFDEITRILRNIYQKELDPLVIDQPANDCIQTPDTTLSTFDRNDGYVDV